MSRILRFLFPTTRYTARASLFLLALRVLFGVLLLSHGIAKVDDFAALSEVFPDPLGLGSRISLTLARSSPCASRCSSSTATIPSP